MIVSKEVKIILRIGILGYSYDLSTRALHEIVNNDEFNYKSISKFVALMNDDVETRYYAINPNSENGIMGTRLDQLIIVDDERWEILDKHGDFINHCINPCLVSSCVPEEFKIQKYEW